MLWFDNFIESLTEITKVTQKYQLSIKLILVTASFQWGHFKIFKNQKIDLSIKSPERNMWLLINHTKSANTNIETNIFIRRTITNQLKVYYNQPCD